MMKEVRPRGNQPRGYYYPAEKEHHTESDPVEDYWVAILAGCGIIAFLVIRILVLLAA